MATGSLPVFHLFPGQAAVSSFKSILPQTLNNKFTCVASDHEVQYIVHICFMSMWYLRDEIVVFQFLEITLSYVCDVLLCGCVHANKFRLV